MLSQRSVLIVDRSQESREVLRTALERRGVRIWSAERAQEGLALAKAHRPDLIILDLEAGRGSAEEICAPFTQGTESEHSPLVVLGTVRRQEKPQVRGEIVAKPYHYGPLIRRIEEILDASKPTYARSA